jgi:NAD(P)-dependent dehydrogenase (short-subunit alcohol dehydrogenase family)
MAADRRVAVVTGGGRGIGRGIVGELAALGLSVVVNYRGDAGSAAEACREAEARGAPEAVAVQADVADLAQGRRLLDEVMGRFRRVDVWVNNAGVAPAARLDLLETTPESWDRVLGTNLRGPFFLTQAVARVMADLSARGAVVDPQIVFVTSVSSTFASVNRGEYCVSKAGLSMVARLFAVRLAEAGVRVTEVRPGVIATDMTGPVREQYDRRIAEGLSPIRRWGTPADVGKAVAAIASGAFPFTTGDVVHVDGGLNLDRL